MKVYHFKIQEEIHHYLDTVQDKIARVVIPHVVRSSFKAHATVTVHILCECLLPKKLTKSQQTEKLFSEAASLMMELPGMVQKMEQMKEQQEAFMCLCLG